MKGNFPLIAKDSVAHVHWLAVYLKVGLFFAHDSFWKICWFVIVFFFYCLYVIQFLLFFYLSITILFLFRVELLLFLHTQKRLSQSMLLLIKFPFEIFYSKDHNIITFLTLTTLLRLLTFLLGFQILMLKAIILDLFVALELSLCFALAVSPLAMFLSQLLLVFLLHYFIAQFLTILMLFIGWFSCFLSEMSMGGCFGCCCWVLGMSLVWNPAGNYMFKAKNGNTRTRCEICLKLAIKTPERRQTSFWCLYC